MAIVKSFSSGNGDTFYIKHGSDNFTIIDCNLNDDNKEKIVNELKKESKNKGITRFISTHPDQDHFGGIEYLDEKMPIVNFYVVKNKATKSTETVSFKHYCKLRDGEKAFYIYKNCKRKWMNEKDDDRGSAGISILWPKLDNEDYINALKECESGGSPNNISAVVRYSINDGASFLWIGDLENDFMEKIFDDIKLEKTTIVFASHHGRESGKIPNSWLEKLDPQIIVIGKAPARHLHYYTGYSKITQNRAGDITFECDGGYIHIYSSNEKYEPTSPLSDKILDLSKNNSDYYIGSIELEKEYTLENMD